MALEEVIAGVTFTGFATLPPTISGLQALGIFGTGKDGKNTNRAPGGPAFVNLTNPPVFGTNFITVNNNTSTVTPTTGIDTNVAETAASLASGWTMFMIARYLPSSANGTVMSIGTGQSTCAVLNPSNSLISNHPSFYIAAQGLSFTSPEQTIDLAGISLANWRMYAVSYPAGAGARPYRVTDVTGGTEKITTTTHSRALVGTTNHFNFGAVAALPANIYQNTDVAAGGVAFQPQTLAQLQTIRTWLLGVLGPRGVTGF
jgi:hypothetical protein